MSADIILLRPKDGKTHLVPATAHDLEELIASVAPGRDCRAKLTQSRSLPQHRFYWGLLSICVKNHSFYKTSQAIHIWLKLKLGVVDFIELHDGRTHIHVGSTSFEKMDGISFKQYLDASINLIITEILPGVNRRDLLHEVEKMLDITFASLKFSEAA